METIAIIIVPISLSIIAYIAVRTKQQIKQDKIDMQEYIKNSSKPSIKV